MIAVHWILNTIFFPTLFGTSDMQSTYEDQITSIMARILSRVVHAALQPHWNMTRPVLMAKLTPVSSQLFHRLMQAYFKAERSQFLIMLKHPFSYVFGAPVHSAIGPSKCRLDVLVRPCRDDGVAQASGSCLRRHIKFQAHCDHPVCVFRHRGH